MEANNGGNTPPKGQDFNTQDIIANLRFADKYLVNIIDFFFGVPFLTTPMLWKILMVIFILTMPLMAVITLVSAIAGIVSIFLGNLIGVFAAVIAVVYVFWLAKTTLFNPASDLKLADLRGWSKMWMVAIFVSLVISAINNVWVRGLPGAVSVLITDFITITLTMYLAPFFERYFWGVVLDGLEHHPDSKYHPKNATAVNEQQ